MDQQSNAPFKLIEAHSHIAKFKHHVSKPLVMTIAAVLFVIAAAVVVWFTQAGPLAKLGVDVALAEGTVEYRLNADQSWQSVPKDLSLSQGAEVRTQDNARAILNIDDGSSVRLNANSSVAFTKLVIGHIVVENKGGDVYTRVMKSDSRKFEVVSGDTSYRSLGTAYRTIKTDKQEGVEVYHSKVSILGLNSSGDVVVEQGKRYYKVNLAAPDVQGKVTELSPEEVAGDSFMQWNSEEDKKEFKNELGILFDLKPPALEVSTPADGLTTDSANIDLKGTTERGVKILLNGTDLSNNNGTFGLSVPLNVGSNGFTVEAIDGAGNKTVKNIVVTRKAPAVAVPAPKPTFTLYGSKVDGGISFSWNVAGHDASKGFKLVKGTSANPAFPGSDGVFLDASKRTYTLSVKDGKTYHFRICIYNGSGCSVYSNNIAVTAPLKESSSPEKPTGSLSLAHAGGTGFTWALNGSAPYGYKLVWATSPGPVYPGSSASFYDKGTTVGNISAGTGTYYVRICMYYEGGCKNYSNEVTVTLP